MTGRLVLLLLLAAAPATAQRALDSAAVRLVGGRADSVIATVVAQPPAAQPARPAIRPAAADTASLGARLAAMERTLARLAAANDSLARALRAPAPTRAAVPRRIADTTVAAQAQQTIQDAGDTLRFVGLRAIFSVAVLVLALFAVRGVVSLLEALAARSAERRLFYKKIIPIVRLLIWSLAAYLVIAVIFEVSGQGFVTAVAAIGVGVAFAAQDILKNIFGGLVIIFDQPFQVGDKVAVGDTYGEVLSIGIRSTRIQTPDDNLVSVPNAQIVDSQVSNANAGALDCQVVTDLYLPGWVDVQLAKRIAYEAAASSRFVFLDKPVVVICKDEFKETFLLHLKVKAYVLDHKFEFPFVSDVTETAKAEFARHGLLQPFRQDFLFDPPEDRSGSTEDRA